MAWQGAPIGMIRYEELLNALLAIWKTRHSIVHTSDFSEFAQGHQAGFEEGLDAIAQIAGLTEAFEAGKNAHRAKIQARLNSKIEIVDGQAILLNHLNHSD